MCLVVRMVVKSIGLEDQCMAFVSYRGVSRCAEELTTVVRAMPPVVAGCRSSGGQVVVKIMDFPFRTIRGRSSRIGRCLLFRDTCTFFCALCRYLSPCVVGQWVRAKGHIHQAYFLLAISLPTEA